MVGTGECREPLGARGTLFEGSSRKAGAEVLSLFYETCAEASRTKKERKRRRARAGFHRRNTGGPASEARSVGGFFVTRFPHHGENREKFNEFGDFVTERRLRPSLDANKMIATRKQPMQLRPLLSWPTPGSWPTKRNATDQKKT